MNSIKNNIHKINNYKYYNHYYYHIDIHISNIKDFSYIIDELISQNNINDNNIKNDISKSYLNNRIKTLKLCFDSN